jgi:hypothetical protein
MTSERDRDPFLASARRILRQAHDDMRVCIEGLPADALNRRPAGDETNSIAVLAISPSTGPRRTATGRRSSGRRRTPPNRSWRP